MGYDRQRGLTLVEVLAGLSILLIIIAIVVPVYSSYVTRSKIAGEISQIGPLKVTLGEAVSNNSSYDISSGNPNIYVDQWSPAILLILAWVVQIFSKILLI